MDGLNRIIIFFVKSIEEVNCLAGKNFDAAITSSSTLFFGKCGDCIKKS